MSIALMGLVWDRAPYDGGTLLVLLALADWANEEGVTWPSMSQLAGKSRMQVRNARYILRKLEDDQCITRESTGSGRATTVYRLNIAALQALPPAWKHRQHDAHDQIGTKIISAPDYVPMQNLHEAPDCRPEGHPIAALTGNDCRPEGHPIAALGGNVVPPNRQGTVREPSPPPTPPAGAEGAGFSLSPRGGIGTNPSPPIHPPTPLSPSPPQDGYAQGETVPGLTRDDIRAFMATLWREETMRVATDGTDGTPTTSPEGAQYAQGAHHEYGSHADAPGAPDARGLAGSHEHAGGPGAARTHPPPDGGRLADHAGGGDGRDQSPVCLQVGPAVPGAGHRRLAGSATPPPPPGEDGH